MEAGFVIFKEMIFKEKRLRRGPLKGYPQEGLSFIIGNVTDQSDQGIMTSMGSE